MAVLKESGIPLGRMMLVPKSGNLTKEDLIIEANGSVPASGEAGLLCNQKHRVLSEHPGQGHDQRRLS